LILDWITHQLNLETTKLAEGDAERDMNQDEATRSREQSAFHADDLDEIASYRSLSGLAIVGVICGLAAPLCFLFPLLTAIPLFGTAISLLALRRIDASEGALVGRWAAVAGLALCIASAVATVSYAQVTRFLHVRQAESFARHWIGLLSSGQLDQAFKLTSAGNRPLAPPSPGEPTPPKSPFEEFTQNPLIQQLSSIDRDSDVRLVETMLYQQQPGHQCIVRQRFAIASAANDTAEHPPSSEPLEAVLTLQRSRLAGETQLRWLVVAYEDAATQTASG
jgi:hypothetical protein